MVCPKCGKKVSSEDYNCIYCGVQLKSTDPEKRKKKNSIFGKKTKEKPAKKEEKKPAPDMGEPPDMPGAPGEAGGKHLPLKRGKGHGGGGASVSSADRSKGLKIGIIAVLAAAVVVLTVMAVHSFNSSKGQRFAEQASDYIGMSVGDLNRDSELFYADSTDYYGINSTMSYDCIGESSNTVKVQGIKFPEWTVTLKLSDVKFITDVTYTDFTTVKHDIRGVKCDHQISLERFHDGDKQSSVLREIGMKPYSITYSQAGTVTYTYKYYYKRDNDDEQAVLLRAVFTEKGKYRYSSAELLFPENM